MFRSRDSLFHNEELAQYCALQLDKWDQLGTEGPKYGKLLKKKLESVIEGEVSWGGECSFLIIY